MTFVTSMMDPMSSGSFFGLLERGSPNSSIASTRTPSPASTHSYSDFVAPLENAIPPVVLGVCAMDVKARSKAMREILTRLVERSRGSIEVKVFGDKVILDEGMLPFPMILLVLGFIFL
jgi:inositol hexakisphosphate/diphosphoinositol-pentakisphosphate kinase